MEIKKNLKIFFLIVSISIILLFTYNFFSKNDTDEISEVIERDEVIYNSNIIENVEYKTKDVDGNEYIVTALQGEIDFSNSNIIYLTNVRAIIKLKNSDTINIKSDFGKYNIKNFDTIFSKNVLITYLENKINGNYLDFSYDRNSMIISKNVIYTNLENILKADVIEIDIKTKDTKIFMYESTKRVNIKSKNLNDNN